MSKKKKPDKPENAEVWQQRARQIAKEKVEEATEMAEDWVVQFKQQWGFDD